jgi:hypothetical protein
MAINSLPGVAITISERHTLVAIGGPSAIRGATGGRHRGEAFMKVTLVADPYTSGFSEGCPKIWRTEDGRYWLQGTRPSADLVAEIPLPDHEFLVEIDSRLIGWTPPKE